MADDLITAAELLVINDSNLADVQISDLLDRAPLLRALGAEMASDGTQHKYVKETAAPVVGFRAVNAGRDWDVSTDTLVTVTLQILDATFGVDKALANQYKRGGAAAWIAREGRRHLKAAFFAAEKQIINGTGIDAAGFTGLIEATTLDALADAMVVDGGGVAANVQTSVYAIRTNNDGSDCSLIVGAEGLIDWGETYEQAIEAAGSQLKFPAYVTPILGYLGLQIGSAQSVGRLANVDATATLTDDMLADLLATAPADRPFNLLVMNRTSQVQLQKSRTATNATGAPAPFPMEAFGVPIITTEAITSTEAVEV